MPRVHAMSVSQLFINSIASSIRLINENNIVILDSEKFGDMKPDLSGAYNYGFHIFVVVSCQLGLMILFPDHQFSCCGEITCG